MPQLATRWEFPRMTSATADNTLLREIPAHGPKPAGPCAMVIFGITGDLSRRLLLPSLYNLASHGLLSDHFAIAGFASSNPDEEQFRQTLTADLAQTCGRNCDIATIRWL